MTDEELIKRLERLERDNRRMKRLGLAGLAVGAVLLIGYTASCSGGREGSAAKKIPQKIAARGFDLVDSSGRVRVKIAMDCPPAKTDCWPAISLSDEGGKARTIVGAGSVSISGDSGRAELLEDVLQFNSGPKAASGLNTVTARLEGSATHGGALWLFGKGSEYAFVFSDPPTVEIQDSKGFITDVGTANLTATRTGESSRTSAASIVMFGDEGKHQVIWRAL